MIRHLMSRLREDVLLMGLLAAALPLLVIAPASPLAVGTLVDWDTIAALAGLMVLSRGLEDSGALREGGRRMLLRVHCERRLAVVLVLFSAALARWSPTMLRCSSSCR
jgi:Na+/H+ antiporter NhaD/arsenite permease-like protein